MTKYWCKLCFRDIWFSDKGDKLNHILDAHMLTVLEEGIEKHIVSGTED